MIHPSGTFNYKAEFTSESFRESDIVLNGTNTDTTDGDRLVGHQPMIRFWSDRLVLVAAEKSHSSSRNFSFAIGDAVSLSAQPGDLLQVVRTGSGGIGLSLHREGLLVLAIGAVTAVGLGVDIKVMKEPPRSNSFLPSLIDRWLKFQFENEDLVLRQREFARIKNFEIYVERCWEDGIPGTDECVSICGSIDPAINIACLRSAVLLGNGDMKLTRWDNSEGFIRGYPM